jgi:hypothetical protein
MAKSTHDLVQALSETERKELLDRIQRSLSLNPRSEKATVRAPTSADQRTQLIQEGLHQLGLLQRMRLWLRKWVTSKSIQDLYIELKLEDMAKQLLSHKIADAKAKTIDAAFPTVVYQLYLMILPVKRFLQVIWQHEQTLRSAVQYVIEQRVPRAKSALFDFIPEEEMQGIFENAESKSTIRQELMNRVNQYLEAIPLEIFSELEQSIMPLYNLRQLCFFDYYELFRAFQADPAALDKGVPKFGSAAAEKVLPLIEDLYFAVHTAKKAASLDILPPQLFKFVQIQRYEPQAASKPAPTAEAAVFAPSDLPAPEAEVAAAKAAAEHAAEEGLRQLRKDLRALQDQIAAFIDRSAVGDLIRLFQHDPYYRFIAYTPAINLKDFYLATLRMNLLHALDEQYATIRQLIVENIRQQLFPNGLAEFDYFKKFPAGTPRSGLPGFRYARALTMLYSFLKVQFVGSLRETFRFLVKILPSRNRDVGSELLFHTTGLESLFDALKIIDLAFSPDTDDGKSFMRMKQSMEKDVAQERQYRAFVAQHDKEIRDMIEEGIEHLRALAESLQDLYTIPAALLGERFTVAAGQNGSTNFSDFLRGLIGRLRAAHRLLRYQRALDDEMIG